MAEIKKPLESTVKTATTPAPAAAVPAKVEEKKAEVKEKVAEKKAEVKEKVAEKKAVATKKVAEKKVATVKKAAVKKTVVAAKKTAVKKAVDEKKAEAKEVGKPRGRNGGRRSAKSEVIHIQIDGKDYTREQLLQSAKDIWVYDLGRKLSEFNSVELYLNVNESRAYYVINEDVTGSFDI